MDPTKSYVTKKADTENGQWFIIDAEDQVLGRVASVAAQILRGKYNVKYTPHLDLGDHVIVINADKIKVTGKKLDQKKYYHHTGWFGGIKEKGLRDRKEKDIQGVIRDAVWGMIPKNRLGRKLIKKLRVYGGTEHPHAGQNPQHFELKNIK